MLAIAFAHELRLAGLCAVFLARARAVVRRGEHRASRAPHASQGLDGFDSLSRNDISISGRAKRLHATVPGSLAHLPAIKQRQLQAVIRVIRAAADVEHIILFGSHARVDWVEDFTNGYISDFDILVLVANQALAEDHALWMTCRDRVRCFTADTPVSFIIHTVKDVNQQIARGSSFFRDATSEGVILHDAGRITLAEVKPLTPNSTSPLGRYPDTDTRGPVPTWPPRHRRRHPSAGRPRRATRLRLPRRAGLAIATVFASLEPLVRISAIVITQYAAVITENGERDQRDSVP